MLASILEVSGLIGIAVGAGMVYLPAGVIVLGIGLLVIGVALDRSR